MDNAFKVTRDGQIYDYRVPQTLNLNDIVNFFASKYKVVEVMQTGRHVTGILNDGRQDLFLKLATTNGISIITQIEYKWNEEFNRKESAKYHVPKNVSFGNYNGLYYFLTQKVDGTNLATVGDFTLSPSFELEIPEIISFADYIMSLNLTGLERPDVITGSTPQEWFVNKTKSWLDSIPPQIQSQYGLLPLFVKVETGVRLLATKVRHGDFTPWHLLKTSQGLVLLDGEHAMSEGVELYDIGYLIQRIHTICKSPSIAQKILLEAEKGGHRIEKLKVILAARAIGGFLDAHLAHKNELEQESHFRDWVLSI